MKEIRAVDQVTPGYGNAPELEKGGHRQTGEYVGEHLLRQLRHGLDFRTVFFFQKTEEELTGLICICVRCFLFWVSVRC